MNRKAKGTRHEYRSIQVLEAAGYRCTSSAASLGEWDVIGVGSHDVVLLQVKSTRWPGSIEMEYLREFTAPPSCRKLIHRWRQPATATGPEGGLNEARACSIHA